MAQYSTIEVGTNLDLSDGTDSFRYYVAPLGTMHLYQALTELGFAGAENTDWVDLEEYPNLGGGVWRIGVRELNWVMDCALNGTGFSGDEDIDWANYEKHKIQ